MYFLDTNICVYFLKGMHSKIKDKIATLNPKDIKIPSIVKAELLYGAEKSEKKKNNLKRIHAFLEPFEIINFDDESAAVYSAIRSTLEKKGITIGPNDYIIASVVIANNGTLVTNNIKEFKRIKNLKVENWL